MADRSRREQKSKLEKLAEYKRAREGGGRVRKEEDGAIYDEVSEDQYRSVVRGRLQKDDFVEDDGVGGYVDNGMEEDWDGANEEPSSDEDAPKKKKGKNASKAKAKPPPVKPPSISAYRPVVSKEQESDFMASLLGELDAVPVELPSVPRSRKRKPSPYRSTRSYADTSSDGPIEQNISSDDLEFSPQKKIKTDVDGITPAADRLAYLDMQSSDGFNSGYEDIDMDSFMADDLDIEDDAMQVDEKPEKKEAKKEVDTAPAWLSVYDSLPASAPDDQLGPLSSSSTIQSSNISALEPDGSLHFFWLEYLENDGRLYFVGKLKDKVTNTWVSCCITVENMQRNIFVLPRTKPDEFGEVPELQEVYSDFDMLRSKTGVKSWKGRFVKRNYAFGESDVPREETQWLKAVYGFNEPEIPITDANPSPNIARIFGTNTTAFELLALKRKIMGPCWLVIKNPKIENKSFSWCKLEATVTDPKDINPFPDTDKNAPKDTPPLTIMSLSVRTIVNHHENKREVVCTTARTWHNMLIDDTKTPEELPCTVQTFVRPLDKFPPNFEAQAMANGKGAISPMKNERMLLSSLLNAIYRADPDIIVGHEFLGVSLDVLLHRMKELKADHWSRLGRFRRSKWPSIGKQGSNLRFLSGRLLCDLGSDGAKTMISSTTWSLTEMCKTHLKRSRQDIDPDDTASYLEGSVSNPDRMLTFVRHCELDAHFHMAIAAKVQMLPLTKQLTNLAGNSWNKTLNGGRAERNEYILLHEFHRLKYICPDKTWGKKSKPPPEVEDEEGGGKSTKKKRDKYKGGLVFEPKRGLWDKYILVMDFNSLYPSIIQEFNIDFTTVNVDEEFNDEGEEKIPDPPDSKVAQGVLPRLIATLVNRRRNVKKLMKEKGLSLVKLQQYDIRQQALKLTANSMYGCLGFEYSRFYARPLAALTTFKGREILTRTRELAEGMELDVVYGDTDSVFVNTNVVELDQAMMISDRFKRAVNEQYNLLEIDLDGIFQRLLLLQKKKYAALKVEEGQKTSTEVKGLDMKRREYCALSKNVSQYVLTQILSGDAQEDAVQNIHDYLATVGQNVREGKVKLDEFTVHKRLGKNPEDYPDAKSQPHVQVALRMKLRGGDARHGDVIPYVFCIAEGEQTAKTAQADRARHPDEFRKPDSGLKLDFEYYLGHQVLPPIERLCEPIEGTDRSRLAECLGLDPSRYKAAAANSVDEPSFSTLDSQMTDSERFKDASPFIIRCRKCKVEAPFAPIHDREHSILHPTGLACTECKEKISAGSLQTQLETQIRDHIAKYYEGWTVCDDTACGHRTRKMGVRGRRCLQTGCRGKVVFEYSDARLYNQLRYYGSLFNAEKVTKAVAGSTHTEAVNAVVLSNLPFLHSMAACVERYLDQSARRWVELSTIFSFMNV
ncbi:DNA polymerase family B-domain-containing protein [Mycena metata]|uniref:DNA polymerase n=1 Tax=Mycena metata TaxID=1033252 RepID=A0AAD7HCQ6_9AGAR|nr:DNA polymerase family B-domain-containing protein [Mycena metata]